MLGDGAEGYSGENGGDDVIAGDALATNRNGTATANSLATAAGVAVGFINLEVAAGSDTIRGGGGDALLAGDAMASHEGGGDATADNAAVAEGGEGKQAPAGSRTHTRSLGYDTQAGARWEGVRTGRVGPSTGTHGGGH